MAAHSTLAPSSAAIWAPRTGCPGWRTMHTRFPDTEVSEAAKEGTAAHELAERMLRSAARAGLGFPEENDTVGQIASNGVVITEAIYEGAKVFHDIVAPKVRGARIFAEPNLGIEARVAAPNLIHTQAWGTADAFLYEPSSLLLSMWDLKFGYKPVSAFENWQLIVYAAGVIETLGLTNPDIVVSLNIVQPRVHTFTGAPDEWRVKFGDLIPYIEEAREGADRSFQKDAPTHSGDHCRYCTARHDCPAAIAAGLQYIEATEESVPSEMTTQQQAVLLRTVLRAQRHLLALSTGLEAQLEAKAKSGQPVPGFRIVPKTGYRSWEKPNKEIFQLGEMFGIDLRKNEPLTPNQAENAGLDPEIVAAYSHKPVNGTKLIEDDGSAARKVFT